MSLLPYLFPLVDSIQYGVFMLNQDPNSPLTAFVATIYAIYQVRLCPSLTSEGLILYAGGDLFNVELCIRQILPSSIISYNNIS